MRVILLAGIELGRHKAEQEPSGSDVQSEVCSNPWCHGVRVAAQRGGPADQNCRLQRDIALDLPFAEPTGYGLGKSGGVSARFAKVSEVPLDLLKAWIDESYRAIAPKKLVKMLG